MPKIKLLEYHCKEITRMEFSSKIRAIELILQSLNNTDSAVRKGRLSELKGIGKGTWKGVDIDKFIRVERDSWDS